MPDKQGNMEPEQKDEDTPGTPHKGGFGEQEADARPDDVPGDEVPGR